MNSNQEDIYVKHQDCFQLINDLPDNSIDLLLTDPPYYGIVNELWDNQWNNQTEFVDWLYNLFKTAKPKLKSNGSLIFFGAIGKHGEHPMWSLMQKIEKENLYFYRNYITWNKKRAYGKSHDYLFTREEIAWYSVSQERTNITFNIPLTNQLRGYKGFNKKYNAKSDYKRVTNVWTDINELFKPSRPTQKPIELMNRLILTHSNEGDLIVDPFAGYGTTGIAAITLKRKFIGSESIKDDAEKANQRCINTFNQTINK